MFSVTPKFDPKKRRHDETTFMGRWRNFLDVINPLSLLYSSKSLDEAQQLINQFKAGTAPAETTDNQLWKARWLIDATSNPGSGERIVAPFRFSGLLVVKIPILTGMLLTPKTPATIALWQTLNQAYTFGFSYFNRNGSNHYTDRQLAQSAVTAICTSVVVGLALDKLIIKYLGTSNLIRTFGPAAAMGAAGLVNLLILRYREIQEGIAVFDDNGKEVGRSYIAAKDALYKTSLIRFWLQFPYAYCPVLAVIALSRCRLYPAAGPWRKVVDMSVTGLNITLVPTSAQAFFPQKLWMEKLEPELVSPTGFYYNRGL
jgi:hypothetical protein